jgi:hypothetical protein
VSIAKWLIESAIILRYTYITYLVGGALESILDLKGCDKVEVSLSGMYMICTGLQIAKDLRVMLFTYLICPCF